MISMANVSLPHKASRQQIASAITVVIQALRLTDGRRRITSIQEITGMEGDVITMQEIFAYHQTGVDASGNILGHFQACGVRPRFVERLQAFGIDLPERIFAPDRRYH
jgi:pilus assembly protein CpaF